MRGKFFFLKHLGTWHCVLYEYMLGIKNTILPNQSSPTNITKSRKKSVGFAFFFLSFRRILGEKNLESKIYTTGKKENRKKEKNTDDHINASKARLRI